MWNDKHCLELHYTYPTKCSLFNFRKNPLIWVINCHVNLKLSCFVLLSRYNYNYSTYCKSCINHNHFASAAGVLQVSHSTMRRSRCMSAITDAFWKHCSKRRWFLIHLPQCLHIYSILFTYRDLPFLCLKVFKIVVVY